MGSRRRTRTEGEVNPDALALLERFGAQMLATARRYAADPHDAEDAYQRATEILLTHRPTGTDDELCRWLRTTTKHEALAMTDGVVLLRPWQESDLPVLERASADEYVAEIERLPTPFTETGGREWINRKLGLRDRGQGWAFAIVELASGEVVGGLGIKFRHPPDAAEPGWWVIAGKRNEGIAERAGRLLCRWALTDDTGIARIQATVEPWNLASQRLLEKLGFVREGLLRSYSAWRGTRQDVFLYSLLPDDLNGNAEGEVLDS